MVSVEVFVWSSSVSCCNPVGIQFTFNTHQSNICACCTWISNDYKPPIILSFIFWVTLILCLQKNTMRKMNRFWGDSVNGHGKSSSLGNFTPYLILCADTCLKYLGYACSLVVFFLATGMSSLKSHVQTSTVRKPTTCDWFGSYSNGFYYSKDQDDHYAITCSNQETPNRFHPRGYLALPSVPSTRAKPG